MLLVISAVLSLLSARLGGLLLRPILLLACIGCSVYLFFGVWHMHRVFIPNQAPADAIRIAHWNQSSKWVDQEAFSKAMIEQEADIVFVSNAKWGKLRQTLLNGFAPFAPDEHERWVNYSFRVYGLPAHYRIEGDAFVASKFPMTRTGMVSMNMPVDKDHPIREQNGRGWVMFIEIDLREDTEPLIVWFVDLPSDPNAWRQDTITKARLAVNNWNGRSWVMGRHVWESVDTDDTFPEPDLIIGDFNTLRGSDSLSRFVPNMRDAFELAGHGRARSWVPGISNGLIRQPFHLADWHIDMTMVSEGWNAIDYQILRTDEWGEAEHRMQMIDLNRQF